MAYIEGSIKNAEFFTTAELAEKLKMNVQVITRKVQAGEIEAFKIGKDWRIPESAVYTWLQERSNKNGNGGRTKVPKAAKADRMEALPAPGSKRKFLLEYILAQFEPHKTYSETDVNRTISRYHKDVAAVRREFMAEKMMEETDGKYQRRTGYTLAE